MAPPSSPPTTPPPRPPSRLTMALCIATAPSAMRARPTVSCGRVHPLPHGSLQVHVHTRTRTHAPRRARRASACSICMQHLHAACVHAVTRTAAFKSISHVHGHSSISHVHVLVSGHGHGHGGVRDTSRYDRGRLHPHAPGRGMHMCIRMCMAMHQGEACTCARPSAWSWPCACLQV